MYRRHEIPPAERVTLELEGRPVVARAGEPLAASLWAAGEPILSRSPKYHRPRGPYCFAAACSNCLMRVDGAPDRFSCQLPAREGLRLERQNAFPSARHDLAELVDAAFPRGMDHHHLMVKVPVARTVTAQVARRMAGLGRLPDETSPDTLSPPEELRTEVAIVGAGVAGLAAAHELARLSVPFLIIDRDPFPDPTGGEDRIPVRRAEAVGLYREASGRFLVAAARGDGRDLPSLLRIEARHYLIATGGHAPLPTFQNNDRPGVVTAEAASRLLRRHGLVVGQRVAVAFQEDKPSELLSRLAGAGAQVMHFPIEELEAALGRSRVTGVRLRSGQVLRCDALVLKLPSTPAYELAVQGGAALVPHSGKKGSDRYRLACDADGRTGTQDLLVAGRLAGATDRASAQESGRAAARAIARAHG